MEKYVCSLELAKKLKELGVKQESEFYWLDQFPIANETGKPKMMSKRQLKEYKLGKEDLYLRAFLNKVYPAFTVGELGEGLPGWIYSKKNSLGDGGEFVCADFPGHVNTPEKFFYMTEADTEANARAKMRIYLIVNKFMEA